MVDLLKMKAIIWDEASQGMKFDLRDIPCRLGRSRQMAREHGRGCCRGQSEELMNKYLEEGTLSEEDIVRPARTHHCHRNPPMLCGTAFKNKGVQRMLDAVIDYLPSPVDIPDVEGTG